MNAHMNIPAALALAWVSITTAAAQDVAQPAAPVPVSEAPAPAPVSEALPPAPHPAPVAEAAAPAPVPAAVAPAAPAPVAEVVAPETVDFPPVRLSGRGLVNFVENDSYQPLSDNRGVGGGELGLDVLLGPHWMAGMSYVGRVKGGDVYGGMTTALSADGVRLSGGRRYHMTDMVTVYGRAGLGAQWWNVDFNAMGTGGHVTAHTFAPEFFAGLGADVWLATPVDDRPATMDERFGVALNVELIYDRTLPLDFRTDQSLKLGSIDPSGPGFQLGLVMQF